MARVFSASARLGTPRGPAKRPFSHETSVQAARALVNLLNQKSPKNLSDPKSLE